MMEYYLLKVNFNQKQKHQSYEQGKCSLIAVCLFRFYLLPPSIMGWE